MEVGGSLSENWPGPPKNRVIKGSRYNVSLFFLYNCYYTYLFIVSVLYLLWYGSCAVGYKPYNYYKTNVQLLFFLNAIIYGRFRFKMIILYSYPIVQMVHLQNFLQSLFKTCVCHVFKKKHKRLSSKTRENFRRNLEYQTKHSSKSQP